MKKLLCMFLILTASFCFGMLPSYHSGHDDTKRRFIISKIEDETLLEKGEDRYEEGLELQEKGSLEEAIVAYKQAFLGDSVKNEERWFNLFKERISRNESFEDCLVGMIEDSIATHSASSIAALCERMNQFLEAAFWYAIAYANGISCARNAFDKAITYHHNQR